MAKPDTLPDDLINCASCYLPLHGRVVHVHGAPEHHQCRQEHIAAHAAENADRYISTDIDLARALAEIQRKVS